MTAALENYTHGGSFTVLSHVENKMPLLPGNQLLGPTALGVICLPTTLDIPTAQTHLKGGFGVLFGNCVPVLYEVLPSDSCKVEAVTCRI